MKHIIGKLMNESFQKKISKMKLTREFECIEWLECDTVHLHVTCKVRNLQTNRNFWS